jgi:hypothetical protein
MDQSQVNGWGRRVALNESWPLALFLSRSPWRGSAVHGLCVCGMCVCVSRCVCVGGTPLRGPWRRVARNLQHTRESERGRERERWETLPTCLLSMRILHSIRHPRITTGRGAQRTRATSRPWSRASPSCLAHSTCTLDMDFRHRKGPWPKSL